MGVEGDQHRPPGGPSIEPSNSDGVWAEPATAALDQALELSRQSVDRLLEDVARSAEDSDLAWNLQQAKLTRLEQANTLRNRFFVLASSLAGLTVLTSVVLVLGVLFGADVPTGVAIAFISGLAIETVGVMAIMAGYLFPTDRGAE
ncbi:MAG: hypothetical protein ABIR39_10710 [Nocardioides sp.]|uniref:hypothetical protein n=1 Tax=Nocardioides sp. TaxID=35761 RepID=UPI003267170D